MEPQHLLAQFLAHRWNENAVSRLATSALPEAPQIPASPTGQRFAAVRTHLAALLRRAAVRVEPTPPDAPLSRPESV